MHTVLLLLSDASTQSSLLLPNEAHSASNQHDVVLMQHDRSRKGPVGKGAPKVANAHRQDHAGQGDKQRRWITYSQTRASLRVRALRALQESNHSCDAQPQEGRFSALGNHAASKNVENPRDRNGHVSKKRNAKKGDEKAVKRRAFRFGPCHGTCIGIKSACRSNCVGRLYP